MPPRRAAHAASSKMVADSPPESDVEPSRRRRVNKKNKGNVDDGSDAALSPPEDDSDEEAFQVKKPVKKVARAPAKRAPATSKGKGKATTTARAKAVRALADEDDATESQVDATEDEPPAPKKAATTGKGKAKATAPQGSLAPPPPVTVTDTEDDEPLDEAPSFRTPRPKEKRVAAPVELDDEENIVLEPPTPRPPLIFSPAKPTQSEDTGPKPRLVIHKLALVDFKSYAGRQEIGPFHKSFSAIVGPNGSGKSNTIDALLFVFGYRASKMRQGRLSELIHNSANYPDLDACKVEVHFREITDLPGPDAYKVVTNSSLVVCRTAYKNNTSRYTINDKVSSFTEVTTLLKARGIDLEHKRFLILQGEVESIAQMKPKAQTEHDEGLLEYLEDIIGTSGYKEPIEAAFADLEKLGEERSEKLNRLRIVEREKQALEERKKEADNYLRDQNEYARALSRRFQWVIWDSGNKLEKANETIRTLEQRLEEEAQANAKYIEQTQALQDEYDEENKLLKIAEKEAENTQARLRAHVKSEVELTERKKHAENEKKKLLKAIKESNSSKSEAVHAERNHGETLEKAREELKRLEASLEKEEKRLEEIQEGLKDKTQGFSKQIKAKQQDLQPWTAQISEKQAAIDIARSEHATLSTKVEEAKNAGAQAKDQLERIKAERQEKADEFEQLQGEKANLAKALKDTAKRHSDLQETIQQLRAKAGTARQQVEEAKASQAQNTSRHAVNDALTKLAKMGRIQGFHGRLGNLGTIPNEYDVAVSTACGMLDNMIVDHVEQAQECIEYLRRQNLGRASFVALDKLPNKPIEPIQTPEGVPRLFDLIKFKDPKYAPAFYKAVHDTLVANDLVQANRIAYGTKRWRVVTLAGQLIDVSGTMSGGGGKPKSGGMSSKLASDVVSPEELKRFEKQNESAATELAQANLKLASLEDELEGFRRKGPALEMDIEKAQMALNTLRKRIEDSEKRMKQIQAQSKPDDADVKRMAILEREIKTAEKDLETLKQRSQTIEAEITQLQNQILAVGGIELRKQQSKVDGINQMIEIENDKVTKAEVGVNKARKDIEKHAKVWDTSQKELKGFEVVLEKLKADLQMIANDVASVRQLVKEAQDKFEEQKERLDVIKAELDEKLELTRSFRKRVSELETEIGDAKKIQAENTKKIDEFKKRHDQLELVEIEDEEEEEAAAAELAARANRNGQEGDGELLTDIPPKPDQQEFYWYTEEELATMNGQHLLADVALYEERVRNAKPNLDVLKQYRKREAEFLARAEELDKVTERRDTRKKEYDDLRKRRLDEFMTGFSLISSKLKEMYQMITLGGNAELELVDSMDPFSEGIIFSVMPPKKSWKNISNLSGGEKTLSSLALVFALHVYKPTPLYFMDEIDAALDFRNVSIVANYIKDRTKNAQFIIISLRNNMFELAHRLIGIYKTSNATRSITIDNHDLNFC